MLPKTQSAPTVALQDERLKKHNIHLYLKREDLIHPEISGNKWRKLKYNLLEAEKQGKKTLLTFGGAYSNHIHATAAAAKACEFRSIGIIRGEEHLPLNPTLQFATDSGMELHYVSRSDYREKNKGAFIHRLIEKFGDFYLIPEGGSNLLAVKGCTEIPDDIPVNYDYICAPCGTGGTLAGIIAGLKGEKKILGFSALKGDFLKEEVNLLLQQFSHDSFTNWEMNTDYHFGGYAKVKPELIAFIKEFKEQHHIQLEPIYTGKMLYGIFDLIEKSYFPKGSRIVAIHTGGIQGLEGFRKYFER